MESEKKRATKFTDAEKLALTESIKERYSILFGKLNSTTNRQDKTKAWGEVLSAVNAVSSVTRTLSQIQEKYKNMKKDVKAIAAENKKEITKTGGGTANISDLDASALNILESIPRAAISGIPEGIDTSDFGNSILGVGKIVEWKGRP